MTTVAEMLRRFERIEIIGEVQQSLYDSREEYVKHQKDQMIHGVAKDGSLIGKYKNPQYSTMKYALSSLAGFGNVDLKKTGQYQQGIFAEIRESEIVIGSLDSKATTLEKKYGKRIYGLWGEYRVPFIDFAGNAFRQRIARALHLSFSQAVTA